MQGWIKKKTCLEVLVIYHLPQFTWHTFSLDIWWEINKAKITVFPFGLKLTWLGKTFTFDFQRRNSPAEKHFMFAWCWMEYEKRSNIVYNFDHDYLSQLKALPSTLHPFLSHLLPLTSWQWTRIKDSHPLNHMAG